MGPLDTIKKNNEFGFKGCQRDPNFANCLHNYILQDQLVGWNCNISVNTKLDNETLLMKWSPVGHFKFEVLFFETSPFELSASLACQMHARQQWNPVLSGKFYFVVEKIQGIQYVGEAPSTLWTQTQGQFSVIFFQWKHSTGVPISATACEWTKKN